ncbi:hypothetical protein J3A83DRAFT_4097319 [Scleroderma citrinum]
MMLKYADGRGNIPISHWHYDHPHYSHRDPHYRGPAPRSRPQTPHQRSKSAMGHRPPPPIYHHLEHDDLHYHSEKYGQPISPDDLDYESAPEDIQILPADPNVQPHRVTGSYRPRRSSEPFRGRTQPPPTRDGSDVYDTPPPRYVSTTLNVPASVTYSHSQHIHDPYDHHHSSHSNSRGNRPPPSIVYAPGHRQNTDHFAPPTIMHAKPPGMNHTISASTGSSFPQYPRITTTPYPSVHGHLGALQEEPRYGPRGPRPREDLPRVRVPISESTGSGDSGSTYYVLPSAGQKVKVLNGPEPSLYNGSSTTKSTSLPRTPDSAIGFGPKRPFFSRLISFASDFSRGSKGSRSSRKNLHRRHSIDISTRSQSRDRR